MQLDLALYMVPPDLQLLIRPAVNQLAHAVGSVLAQPDYSGR